MCQPSKANKEYFDEALVPLSSLIEGLTAGGQMKNEEFGLSMSVEQVKLDLPIELEIVTNEDGPVIIGGAPPTQHIETSILPVFHRIKLTMVKKSGE